MKLHMSVLYAYSITECCRLCRRTANALTRFYVGLYCYVFGQIFFVEIGHEIFSTVIFSLPLKDSQEGQLSVSGERMCTSTG